MPTSGAEFRISSETRSSVLAFLLLLCVTQAVIWIGGAVQAERDVPVQRGRMPAIHDDRVQPDAIDAFIVDTMKRTGVPGVALAVVRNDRVAYTAGYGRTSSGRHIGSATPLPIASLSKSFTAAVVMHLVESGRLSLDAPLSAVLTEMRWSDPRAASITIKQLLNQSSGIACSDPAIRAANTASSLPEALKHIRAATLANQPGSEWGYCNANYHLLAAIVERVAGEPFHAYLRRALLAPLGMSRTMSTLHLRDDPPGIEPGHALAYGFAFSRSVPNELAVGGSGVLSTADDLARWLTWQLQSERFIGDSQVLSPASIAAMHTPSAQGGNYGFGWRRGTLGDGSSYVFHSGRIVSYSAHQAVFAKAEFAYAIVWNSLHSVAGEQRAFIDGLNAIACGDVAKPGRPTGRIVDSALAFFTVIWIAIGFARVKNATTWAAQARLQPSVRRSISLIGYGVIVLAVLLLPVWSRWVLAQSLSIPTLFELWPAVAILLIATASASLCVVIARLRCLHIDRRAS